MLYRSGYEWALQEMIALAQRFQSERGDAADPAQMDSRFVLESWWAPFTQAGWGRASFHTAGLGRGMAVVELQDSAVALAFAGSDQLACHLYAGLFAGAVSFLERTEHHAAEMQCTACGAATCVFVVGLGADIDLAETRRQAGTAVAEITRQFR